MTSPLIEDALKSNRNFHRFIITVSLVSIVFALSLSLPHNLVTIKDKVNELRKANFLEYEKFAMNRAGEYLKEKLKKEHDKLESFFNKHNWMVFQTNHISRKIINPVHVGRILLGETVFTDLNNATITELNAISSALKINKNIQVLVPQVDDVLPELKTFFNDNAKTGSRTSNVRLGMEELSFIAESFLYDSTHILHLYFELISDGPFIAAPVFNAPITASVEEVPNTSFLYWLQQQKIPDDIYQINNGEIRWLQSLPNPPEGYMQDKIGILLKRINTEIGKSSPSKQSVSILGTNVPGVLVIYATPLILLALLYYFLQHSNHLIRLVENNETSFKEFSWLPITLEKYWWVEMVFSIILLPLSAIIMLNIKLHAFNQELYFELLLSIIVALFILVSSYYSIRNLQAIRNKLVK